MAPAKDDTGEILSSRIPATSPRGSSLSKPTGKLSTSHTPDSDMDDDDCASSSSSPPTHPAFFSPGGIRTKRQGDTPSSSGKENVCPALTGLNPMAASFSPLGSPLAVLIAKRPSSRNTGGARARASTPEPVVVKHGLSPVGVREGDCNDGDCANGTRGVLKDVDLNIVASLSSEKANGVQSPVSARCHLFARAHIGPRSIVPRLMLHHFQEANAAPKDSSNKKSKRRNKRKNGTDGVNGDNKGQIPEPTSYADAAKQDPADVERREVQSHVENESSDASGKDGGEKKFTPAGNKSFAEALKEPVEHDARSSEKRDSLASTAVDYPELHSDSDGEDEKEQRRRDRQNASQVLSMRWAPLRVPFKRRLQTLAVLFHCLCMGFSLSVFFFCCALVPLWPISKFSVAISI